MKISFWKNKLELIYWLFMTTLCFVMAIIFIILKFYWLGQIVFIVLTILGIVALFAQKRVLSKVNFSEEGIEWTRFKKQIAFIRWDEITDVQETSRSRNLKWLTFIDKDKRIDMEVPTKKMYNAIIEICPEPNIRMMINEINSLKYFHRDK